jgi:O-antigen/teichoic acid export membrane protein
VVLVGRVIAIVLALATLRLSTHFLEPAEYGWLAILQAMQLFAIFFLTNPVLQYINRHLNGWSREGVLAPRLRLYLGYVMACALVAALVFALWMQLEAELSVREQWLSVLLIFLGVIALAWGPAIGSFLNFLGHRVLSILLTAGAALLGLLLACSLVLLSPSAIGWFAGIVAGTLLAGMAAYAVLVRRIPPTREIRVPWQADVPDMLRFSGPLAISAGFMWFVLSGYRLEFDYLWGKAVLGHTVVGLVVAAQVWAVVETLAQQFLYPYVYANMSSGDETDGARACSDFVNVLGPLYLGYAGFIAVNVSLIYQLLVAESYRSGAMFFLVATFIELLRVLTNSLALAAHVRKDTRALIKSYILASGAIALGIFFVGKAGMGIMAACLILLAGAALLLVVVYAYMRRLVPFRLEFRRWSAGAAAALAGGAAGFALLVSGEATVIRMLLVATVSFVVFAAYVALVLFRNPSLARLLQRPLPSQVQSN